MRIYRDGLQTGCRGQNNEPENTDSIIRDHKRCMTVRTAHQTEKNRKTERKLGFCRGLWGQRIVVTPTGSYDSHGVLKSRQLDARQHECNEAC